MNSCSTLACFSRFLQRERPMELLDSVMLLMSWPSAFETVPVTYVAPVWYVHPVQCSSHIRIMQNADPFLTKLILSKFTLVF